MLKRNFIKNQNAEKILRNLLLFMKISFPVTQQRFQELKDIQKQTMTVQFGNNTRRLTKDKQSHMEHKPWNLVLGKNHVQIDTNPTILTKSQFRLQRQHINDCPGSKTLKRINHIYLY